MKPNYQITRLDIAIILGCTVVSLVFALIKWPFKLISRGITWVFYNGIERFFNGTCENIFVWKERECSLNSHEGVE